MTVTRSSGRGGDVTTIAPGQWWVTVGTRFDGGTRKADRFEARYATSVHDDELLMVTPPRRYALANTAFGRVIAESPPRRELIVTASP